MVGLAEAGRWYHGFVWDATGWRFLPVPEGSGRSFADDINEHGQVSMSIDLGDANTASLWRAARVQGQSVTILPSLRGGFDWHAAINNHGNVVMRSEGINAAWHAVVVDAQGTIHDLGSGGASDGSGGLFPKAINDARQIAGDILLENSPTLAFRGHAGGGITLLPLFDGYTSATGRDIDDDGTVVGSMSRPYHGPTPPPKSTLPIQWTPDDQVIDLNEEIDPTSGWVLWSAIAIRHGKIMGMGTRNGQSRVFLLTPTPVSEPPSLAIRLNQATFRAGETLRVTLDLTNPGPLLATDVYVGVILPGGADTLFLTNCSPREGVMTTLSSDPRTFARLLRNVSWPAGMRATQQDYFIYTFTGLEPAATYHFLVAWTKPNSLEDGRIDDGGVLALARAPLTFTPGSSEALYAKAQAIRARHLAQASPALGDAD